MSTEMKLERLGLDEKGDHKFVLRINKWDDFMALALIVDGHQSKQKITKEFKEKFLELMGEGL